MANDASLKALTDFYFAPAPNGFRWIEQPENPAGGRRRGSYLFADWAGEPVRGYEIGDPQVSDLFAKFAELAPTKESVLEFANTYGPLGVWREVVVDDALAKAEPLERWELEIIAMRAAVKLSGAVASGNLVQLRSWLRFDETSDQFVWFKYEDQDGKSTWSIKPIQPISKQLKRNAWKRAGTILLHEMFNKRLYEHSAVGVAYESKKGKLSFCIKHNNLIAAMWVQLAQAAGAGRIQQCAACGDIIVLADGKRSDRKTCDDSCKALLYRQRKKSRKGAKEKKG